MNKFYSGPNKKGSTAEEIADDIRSKFKESSRKLSDATVAHARYLKKYLGIADPLPDYKKDSGASNIFVPLIEPHVDTVVAKTFLTLMGQDPFARFSPETQDAVIPAKVMERVFNFYFYNKMKNSLTNMWLWIRNATLLGTGVVHLFHDKDVHNRTRTVPIPNPLDPTIPLLNGDGQEMFQDVTEEVVDYDGIRFEVIDLSNFAIDWDVLDWRKSWCILREFVDPEVYIMRQETLGYKKLSEEEMETLLSDPATVKDIESGSIIANSNKAFDAQTNVGSSTSEDARGKIELLHYYGKGHIDGVRQEVIYTITNHKFNDNDDPIILGPVPFGVKPFATMRFKPNQDCFLGRGIGAQLEGLQDELNVIRNQRIDNIALELNGCWVMDDGAVDDISQLNSQVGQIIVKNAGAELSKIARQPLPTDAFNSEQSIKTDAQEVTASADLFRGLSARKETATVGTMLNNNAGQRLEAIMMIAMEDGVQDFVNLTRTMIIDFSPSTDKMVIKLAEDEIEKYQSIFETVAPVNNEGFVEFPIEILDKAMHATVKISALAGDNRAKSMELIQVLQTLLPFAQQGWRKKDKSVETIDISYFIKEFLKLNKYTDFRGIFQTLLTAEEAEQKRKLELAQQAAQIQSQTQQSAPAGEMGGQQGVPPPQEAAAQQAAVAADANDRAMSQ